MTEFIVQGRRFKRRLHAVAFAESLAAQQGTSVDVHVEVIDEVRQVRRSWACRMHPPGTQRPYTAIDRMRGIKQPQLQLAGAQSR